MQGILRQMRRPWQEDSFLRRFADFAPEITNCVKAHWLRNGPSSRALRFGTRSVQGGRDILPRENRHTTEILRSASARDGVKPLCCGKALKLAKAKDLKTARHFKIAW